jgi:signal transduction histidine kinase
MTMSDSTRQRGVRPLHGEELATHLQNATELRNTALSHELHDELGALMAAAAMDLDAVRRVKPSLGQNVLKRLDRAQRTLEQAIALQRRVTEELRPSILDNFGLFAALRWLLKETWGNAEVICSETYPDIEPEFESGAAIALFRIAQEALSICLMHGSVQSTDFIVRADSANFWMMFSDDGTPSAATESQDAAMILASMRNRIRRLGGKVEISRNEKGTTALTVWMPMIQLMTDAG